MKQIRACALISIWVATLTCFSLPLAIAEEPQQTVAVILEIPEGARAGPDFDIDTATEAYINLLSAADRARSDAYMEGGYLVTPLGFSIRSGRRLDGRSIYRLDGRCRARQHRSDT